MAPYCTADMIEMYCKLLGVDSINSDTLLAYAEAEDHEKLNPVLWKQYDLSEIATAVTGNTETGKFIKTLSAKLGALAAAKGEYSNNKRNLIASKLDTLEDEVNGTLRQIKMGEIRL